MSHFTFVFHFLFHLRYEINKFPEKNLIFSIRKTISYIRWWRTKTIFPNCQNTQIHTKKKNMLSCTSNPKDHQIKHASDFKLVDPVTPTKSTWLHTSQASTGQIANTSTESENKRGSSSYPNKGPAGPRPKNSGDKIGKSPGNGLQSPRLRAVMLRGSIVNASRLWFADFGRNESVPEAESHIRVLREVRHCCAASATFRFRAETRVISRVIVSIGRFVIGTKFEMIFRFACLYFVVVGWMFSAFFPFVSSTPSMCRERK